MGRSSARMKMLHRRNKKKAKAKTQEAILEGRKRKRTGGGRTAKKEEAKTEEDGEAPKTETKPGESS